MPYLLQYKKPKQYNRNFPNGEVNQNGLKVGKCKEI